MAKDDRFTRRHYLKGSAGLLVGGLLAGCTGGSDADAASGSNGTTAAETTDTTADTTTTETTTNEEETTTAADAEAYTASIVPVGDVEFESVPETWVANNGSWADMGIALGQKPPEGVWLPGRYHTQYYDPIPDVSVDISKVQKLWGDGGVGKEQFHAIGADVHVADPHFLKNRGSWSQSDIDDIAERVGPFFGNSIFSRSYPWHADYRYYTLMEGFEKLAQVFQERERFEAFESLHAEFQSKLAPVVPARSERPSAAVVWGGGAEPEKFYPYIIDQGTSYKHMRDLGVRDALANSGVKNFYQSRGAIDFETLLDVNPQTILLRGQEGKTEAEFQQVVEYFENHQVASRIEAVEKGNVYRAGGLYQGPITNLVLTQRLAEDLYGVEDQLYDPQRVSDIVNGNF